jgi:hypothetical protein
VIDDVDYFVRGVLLIPIVETEERFGFGVWTTLSHRPRRMVGYRRFLGSAARES